MKQITEHHAKGASLEVYNYLTAGQQVKAADRALRPI
jgi:hypothetical protein